MKKTNGPAKRLIQDNDGHWYVIRADEVPIFIKWENAMNGKGHVPAHLFLQKIDLDKFRFLEYYIEK